MICIIVCFDIIDKLNLSMYDLADDINRIKIYHSSRAGA